MTLGWTIAIIAVVFIGGAILIGIFQAKVMGERDQTAVALHSGFEGAPVFHGENVSLYVQRDADKVAIICSDVAPFLGTRADILDVQVVEDGTTVSVTKRKGVIGRAIVGGVALGGVGAIVGGLSAGSETTSRNVVSKIDVIATMSPGTPVARVVFPIYRKMPGTKGDFEITLNAKRQDAERFRAQITELLFSDAEVQRLAGA
ncbi:hypothetical protein [Celeribacter baekdonensis]|uniref:hypothetical protein n=1 Tax=Celeribacter baekdonensis TaxID=875171 RepID=UPI0030D8530D|tara:strand:- start:234636 stop:235244 length:609 start_codon:yes stop_codon:yes gene_type:complete